MTKKTTKKVFKPLFTVDITNCETADSIQFEILKEKVRSNVPLTSQEVSKLVLFEVEDAMIDFIENYFNESDNYDYVCDNDGIDYTVQNNTDIEFDNSENLPWYKRFWNWITRKK